MKRRVCAMLCAALLCGPSLLSGCAGGGVITAEEYFSLGMAFYELGKYEEAEKWFNRAKSKDKTWAASEYNLGRIAFEMGRYREAAEIFEKILKKDPGNVMALKAAAYSRIKSGEFEKAEALYDRVLALEPEGADDGYNYALVLYALEKYEEVETVLTAREYNLVENSDILLLYARTQSAQHKVEAVDSYDKWLAVNSDPLVRYEYGQLLEKLEHYVRALEEYRTALTELSADTEALKRADLRFAIARTLLIADSESAEGITELDAAVSEGFADIEALEALLSNKNLSAAGKDGINAAIAAIKTPALKGDVEGGAEGGDE
jgi:tetratricopeptide (TPR) repeat protein